MQVKLFTIRLDDINIEIDQNSLNDFLQTVTLKKSDTQFVESDTCYWSVLVHYEDQNSNKISEAIETTTLTENQEIVFRELKKWRSKKAIELGLKHFLICYNSELTNIALKHPVTINELKKIKGFGNLKTEKFGNEIISILNTL